MSRVAVVLMNLGGPDRPESVKPFLFNLFNDPAIIGLPTPFRWLLAKLISSRRAPIAREIYRELGGGSPLLANTEAQAKALKAAVIGQLSDSGSDAEIFIAMRYWHPMSRECVQGVKEYGPDIVVLLPLYPQFSTTTSASSIHAWRRAAAEQGLDVPTKAVCCYPTQPGFVRAVAGLTGSVLASLKKQTAVDAVESVPRVLFSAHGLPNKVVAGGDPYQWQVEKAVEQVVHQLGQDRPEWTDLDYTVCYQSRVGPLEWIGPSTDDEIVRAGQDGKSVVLVPIAFVSEHSETLVELDIEYRKLADENGVPGYHRVPTVGVEPAFIDGLASLVVSALESDSSICSQDGARLCPGDWSRCRYKLET